MKKRLVALVLCVAMLLGCTAVRAEDVFSKFQPYTTVDLSVFKDAGYTSSYDAYAFTAELYPRVSEISDEGKYDTVKIKLDLKLVYSAGKCTVAPRMIFSRSGKYSYYDDRMTDIYIKNGENRYKIDVSGCSRSSNSKSSTATDSSVEPIRKTGTMMLADLAHSSYEIDVLFNGYQTMTLTEGRKKIITDFYDTCLKAGVFDQDTLYIFEDDYSILTLFNPGSEGTEGVVTEEPSNSSESDT